MNHSGTLLLMKINEQYLHYKKYSFRVSRRHLARLLCHNVKNVWQGEINQVKIQYVKVFLFEGVYTQFCCYRGVVVVDIYKQS